MALRNPAQIRRAIADVPEKPSIFAVLDANGLTASLTDNERDELVEGCFIAYAERGELIHLGGSNPQFTGIVGTGFVKSVKTTSQGSDIAVELLGPGSWFGLVSGVENSALPFSTVAVTNVWYLKILNSAFQRVFRDSVGMRERVLRSLASSLKRSQAMTARMSSGRVDQRLATVLLLLADSYGETDEAGLTITVPLTRQDLAEMAGTSVETTIRTMSRWQREETIKTEHQVITVLNREVLESALISPS